jgi:hypothetical protein
MSVFIKKIRDSIVMKSVRPITPKSVTPTVLPKPQPYDMKAMLAESQQARIQSAALQKWASSLTDDQTKAILDWIKPTETHPVDELKVNPQHPSIIIPEKSTWYAMIGKQPEDTFYIIYGNQKCGIFGYKTQAVYKYLVSSVKYEIGMRLGEIVHLSYERFSQVINQRPSIEQLKMTYKLLDMKKEDLQNTPELDPQTAVPIFSNRD